MLCPFHVCRYAVPAQIPTWLAMYGNVNIILDHSSRVSQLFSCSWRAGCPCSATAPSPTALAAPKGCGGLKVLHRAAQRTLGPRLPLPTLSTTIPRAFLSSLPLPHAPRDVRYFRARAYWMLTAFDPML